MKPQFLTDEAGLRTGVLLPLETYERMVEDIEDLSAMVARRGEPTLAHADVLAGLRKDGLLPD